MEISGASQRKAEFASSYFVATATAPAENEAHEGHLKQIDLDVPRTFPEHTFFKSGQGQRALTMTLRALAAHMPDMGYCQSLNYVAGLLLLVLDHDPEDAFWVLVVLIESAPLPQCTPCLKLRLGNSSAVHSNFVCSLRMSCLQSQDRCSLCCFALASVFLLCLCCSSSQLSR